MDTVEDIGGVVRFAVDVAERHHPRPVWFRGQTTYRTSTACWRLVPKVFRHYRGLQEREMIREFRRKAPTRYGPIPAGDDALLCLMQHYGIPTRLLDWTTSVLTAAYFAVEPAEPGGENNETDGMLFALLPCEFNEHNGADRRLYRAVSTRATPYLTPAFRDPKPKGSKPKGKALAVTPLEMESRLLTQQSMFTIHADATPIEEMKGCGDFLVTVRIPADKKERIRKELRLTGISQATIFPDLDHLAKDIAESFRHYDGECDDGAGSPSAEPEDDASY